MNLYLIAALSLALVITITFLVKAITQRDNAELDRNRVRQMYHELLESSNKREVALLAELTLERADADRLAVIVVNYVKIIDETAVLLKDPEPPPLTAEREALKLHAEKHREKS